MTDVYVSAPQDPPCLNSPTADRRWARTAAWTSQSRDAWARRAVHVLPELGQWERVQGEGRGAPWNRWDREKQRERVRKLTSERERKKSLKERKDVRVSELWFKIWVEISCFIFVSHSLPFVFISSAIKKKQTNSDLTALKASSALCVYTENTALQRLW